jgi:hypothetical protein
MVKLDSEPMGGDVPLSVSMLLNEKRSDTVNSSSIANAQTIL